MIYLLPILLLVGCRTTAAATSTTPSIACPQPRLSLASGVGFEEPTDSNHIRYAKKGCIKYYGKGACLIHLLKTGERSYRATCRRAK
jgi:hypothetical protein